MRIAALPIPLLTLALAGCQAFAPEPDLATLPHASVTGTHVNVSDDRVDTFRALEINGHRVIEPSDQPVKLIGIDASNLVAADRSVRVEIEGFAFYRNTLRRLAWDPMHVEGTIEFVPAAGARYTLHGSVTPEVSSVWIENDATHEVVGTKISAPGRAVSAPAEREPVKGGA
jgi:hypothetical protein